MTGVVRVLLVLACAVLTSGCGATVQSVQMDPSLHLRDYASLALIQTDSTPTTAESGAVTAQAFNSLKFEMAAIGFQMAARPMEAQLVGEFSIGQIRRDPLVGWIADQAMLILRDSAGNTVDMFRAKSSGITPTVNSLVSQIAKAVSENY